MNPLNDNAHWLLRPGGDGRRLRNPARYARRGTGAQRLHLIDAAHFVLEHVASTDPLAAP